GLRPPREPAFTAAEYELPPLPFRRQQSDGFVGQRHDVGPMVLRPRRRQLDLPLLAVDLAPGQITDLAAALSGEDQQSHDAAVVVVPACPPDLDQLALAQHPAPGPAFRSGADVQGRARVAVAATDRPREQPA